MEMSVSAPQLQPQTHTQWPESSLLGKGGLQYQGWREILNTALQGCDL